MNIEIRRYRIRPETIDGHLFIDGMKVCDTAENANGALPVGTYPATVSKCKQYARKMILLNPNAPCDKCQKLAYCGNNSTLPCYCPMIKAGNGVYKRLDGSIIVGEYIAPGCLKHPKQAFDNLYQRIRKNVERGNEIFVTITEDKPLNF